MSGNYSGGGGGSESRTRPQPALSQSPITGVLANLFGAPIKLTTGGIRLQAKAKGPQFANAAFGPDAFTSIADLLNPIPLRGWERGGADVGQAALEQLLGTTIPTATNLIGTGLRTDMSPIVAQQKRFFERDLIPQIAEQFAQQTGTFSTDFLNTIGQAGADIATDLGALQAQMDEAAAQRQLQALMSGVGSVGATTGADILTLGEQLRQQEQGATPGGQALALMQALAGIVPTGAIPSTPKTRSNAYNMFFGAGGGGGGAG